MTIEPLWRHWFEPNGEGGAGEARIAGDLVRSRDAVAGRADRQARSPAGVRRCRDPGLLDAEGALRAAAAADHRNGGKSTRSCRAGLVGARLQHPLPSPEESDCPHPLSPQLRRAASPDRQHRREGRRRWRVAGQETRALQTTRLAQGPPRGRRGNAGNPGH
jgi:hypothetical protein